MLELMQDPKIKIKNGSQSAVETPITYLPVTIPNYFSLSHVIHFTNSKLSISQIYLITYLDFYIPLNDHNYELSGYTLADYPSNTKCGRVCLYYKNYLPLRVINIGYLKKGPLSSLRQLMTIESPLKNEKYF